MGERINLSTLERLAKAATQGRWYPWWAYKKIPDDGNIIAASAPGHQVRTDAAGGVHPAQNLEHIAAVSPSVVLKLIGIIRSEVKANRALSASGKFYPEKYVEALAEHGIIDEVKP